MLVSSRQVTSITQTKTATLPPWRVLLPVGLGTALSLLGDSALYTVLPTHTAEAGILLTGIGVLLSANRFIRLALNGPVGWLTDRWPRRAVFVPALFIGALSTAIYALTTGFVPLLIGRLLWGAAWSGIWVTGNAIVLDVAVGHNRGRLIGLYNVAFFAGASAGSFLGGWLTDLWGYQWAFGIQAGLAWLGAMVALLFLPETQPWRSPGSIATRVGSATVGKATADLSAVAAAPVATARRGELASAMAVMGTNRILIAGTLAPTFGLFLQQTWGESLVVNGRLIGITTLTGLGLSLSMLLGMVFGLLTGWLSDGAGNRWRMVAGGLLPGIAGFGLLAWGGGSFVPWAIVLGLPLTSVTSGSNQSLATALVGDKTGGGKHGRFLGALFTVGDLGSAIGPLLAFQLIEVMSLQAVYALAAGLFGVMFLMALIWVLVAIPSG